MKNEISKALEEALSRYEIAASGATLLRHNENLTYRIGDEYLLQIHTPVEGFDSDFFYENLDRIEVNRTEIAFLEHLRKRGMTMREVIKNKNGERITVLSGGTPVTVSKWIEGESLDKAGLDDEVCRRIGELVADLHRNSKGFTPRVAVSYDENHCARVKGKIRSLEDKGLDRAYSEVTQRACDSAAEALCRVKNEFIMLHGDLSPSNILKTPRGLVAVDFSMSGTGHPAFDLAVLFGTINDASQRRMIAEGYLSAGGSIDFGLLDACFALMIAGCIAIHFGKWCKEDWFTDGMKRWCDETFEPYAAGEKVFSDDFRLLHKVT